jgi:hypothetical protein
VVLPGLPKAAREISIVPGRHIELDLLNVRRLH